MLTGIGQPNPFRCVWVPPEAEAIMEFLKGVTEKKEKQKKKLVFI